MARLHDFLRVSGDTKYLGGTKIVVQWGNANKLLPTAAPEKGYRRFEQQELDDLLTPA